MESTENRLISQENIKVEATPPPLFWYEETEESELLQMETEEESESTVKTGKKRVRSCWVAPLGKTRKTEGEFATLFTSLENDKEKFKEHFRMSYEKFLELLALISPLIRKRVTVFREPIGAKERLAICLSFLTTGNPFKQIAKNYRMGSSTVHKIVKDTCKCIWKSLSPKVMSKPTKQTWKEYVEGFEKKWGFPNCLGVLDGRIIVVQTPKSSTKTTTLLLLTVVDHNSKFTIVDVGDYNKISENGGIFSNSLLGKLLNSDILKLPKSETKIEDYTLPLVFLGGKTIPQTKNVLRGYAKAPRLDESRERFNKRLDYARKTADIAFRMMINNYPIYQKKIAIKPSNVENMILATCCLHNFLRDEQNEFEESNKPFSLQVQSLPGCGGGSSQGAQLMREKFKDYIYNMPDNGTDDSKASE